MFRRRRRNSGLKIFGLILAAIGGIMLLYIIPIKMWYAIVASIVLLIGLLIFKVC